MTPTVHARVDTDDRAAVITTAFDEPAAAIWTLFSDPTKLARWWGPPGVPMTIDRHDLRPGGSVELTVSTEQGAIHGRWLIHNVAAPNTLTFTFSSDGLETTEIAVDIEATSDTSTTMTITARFPSEETMRHALDIGFVDGVERSCTAAHRVIAAV